jgi:hypothetical protein
MTCRCTVLRDCAAKKGRVWGLGVFFLALLSIVVLTPAPAVAQLTTDLPPGGGWFQQPQLHSERRPDRHDGGTAGRTDQLSGGRSDPGDPEGHHRVRT